MHENFGKKYQEDSLVFKTILLESKKKIRPNTRTRFDLGKNSQVIFGSCCYVWRDRQKKSPLSPILRSLITVRVSQINWCAFCVDINSATLIKRAGSEAQYKQLAKWRSSSLFSPEEKAALDYAEKVTYSDQRPDDECFNQLKLYYSEQEIIELTALIAFQNMSSKFNSALGVEAQGFCSRQLTGKS